MTFAWPTLLLILLCVPLLVILYLRMQQRRLRFAARYGSLTLIHDALGKGAGVGRHFPALIFLAGVSILIVSMARPHARVSLPKVEGTVILTFDISGSMAAADIEPTRMEAAKIAASEFVENQPGGVRIGVVAFSDGGVTVQAPTDDREKTLATIERLVPRRGTSLGNGILVALNTIAVDAGDPPILTSASNLSGAAEPPPTTADAPQGWYTSAVIVMLSDGENNESPDPALVSDLAADLGVRVYTVGVGSLAGADLEVEGFTVHSQLNEPMLQYIAGNTGGLYYNASDEDDLRRIYNDLRPTLTIRPEELEVTFIFAAVGLLVFLVGGMLSLLWFGHVP
jgi:Ca-activated chloride channel family protein